MRKMWGLVVALSIIIIYQQFQIQLYKEWYPKMIWAVDTLYLNWEQAREHCKVRM